MADFASTLRDFERDVGNAIDNIHKQAFKETLRDANTPRSAGGRMPVVTGRLRNSIQVNGVSGNNAYEGAIDAAPAHSTLVGGWDAPYAPEIEFGANGNAPAAFARTAVAKWPMRVAALAKIEDGKR